MSRACWPRVLGALATVLTNGCIVAEPPPYESPPRTPPVLDLWQTIPTLGAPIPVDRENDITPPDDPTYLDFQVPIRSEDHDDWLRYALHIDYFLPDGARLVDNEFPPSTFDDVKRVISFRWRVKEPLTDGCHQLTLLVAHESNWDDQNDRPSPAASGDIAQAVWWINVNAPVGEKNTLRDCPVRGQEVEH